MSITQDIKHRLRLIDNNLNTMISKLDSFEKEQSIANEVFISGIDNGVDGSVLIRKEGSGYNECIAIYYDYNVYDYPTFLSSISNDNVSRTEIDNANLINLIIMAKAFNDETKIL